MKNILLLHPKLLFYKIRIYNQLRIYLEENDYNLVVWAEGKQNCDERIHFELISEEMNLKSLLKVIRKYEINYIVNILSGITKSFFYFISIVVAKKYSIKIIYYGHGIDLRYKRDKKMFWKYYLQNMIHFMFDRILLYSENEKANLWKIHQKKIYVARNTLLLEGYNKVRGRSKKKIKESLNIDEKYIILFSGRIQNRKRLDVIIKMFVSKKDKMRNIALVIVGPNMSSIDSLLVEKEKNMYYFGEVYDQDKIGELFHISDIYCIPGHMGLGIVEAFYWGKPVLTLDVAHAPEIMYLKQGINGYILKSDEELYDKIMNVLSDEVLYKKLSTGARSTYLKEANIENLFNGFLNALNSL